MKELNDRRASLEEVNASVDTTNKKGFWRKLFAFIGPAYLVSVGYMDPGNWATDLAGGSKFGYTLVWVLVMSNLIALLLQSLSARLGLVRGLDLAQASREEFNPLVNFFLWLLAEIAIAATDLAEVIGMAIGLQLLFDIPLLAGVSITVADTLLILVLQKYGMRKMEAFILALIGVIGMAFVAEMFFAEPSIKEIGKGLMPHIENDEALYIAIGIIGATVMPHNLYLHSSLVQTRKIDRSIKGIWSAIKFNLIDTVIALNMALFVNAAILILAASAFFTRGEIVEDIRDAHRLLEPILGSSLAPALFAIALIAAGQSSTLTGTLSGQIVMEGYLNLRIQPWLRRLITRLIAIIPAFITILISGEDSTMGLLVLSQVILSLQLGFAIIPLIHFVSDRATMGEFTIKLWMKIAAWLSASVIVYLNARLVYENIAKWFATSDNDTWLYLTIIPLTVGAAGLLLYIVFSPLIKKERALKHSTPHGKTKQLEIIEPRVYRKVAITIDFSGMDSIALSHAVAQGGRHAEYLLIHIVETAGARMMESEIEDRETGHDSDNLQRYKEQLEEEGYRVKLALGYGDPKKSIPKIVNENKADLLVMGAHGHKAVHDIIFGTTVESVRHNVSIPVLIVRD
jgi:manganese transport protein